MIELGVPGLRRVPPGQDAVAFHAESGYLGVDTYDTARGSAERSPGRE